MFRKKESQVKSFVETIKIIQSCKCCQQKVKVENNILTLKSVDCNCQCEACLKACFSCINENKRCIRRVVLVLTADCERGNKTAFLNITSSIKNSTVDSDLALLIVLPDAVHVSKTLKALFCKWQLIIGNEGANLAIIWTLRSRSSKAVMEKNAGTYSKIWWCQKQR